MTNLDRCYNIFDLREAAQRRLPKGIFEYVDKGTEDGISLEENRAAFQRIKLRTRFLNDWSKRDLGTEIFGKRIELPFGIAPTGSAGLMWYQGEVELARAAAAAGIPLTLAMGALTSMEEVTKAVPDARKWFQLYPWADEEGNYEMVARARDLGWEALVVTIDHAPGRGREHNERNGYSFPFKPNVTATVDMMMHPGWLWRVMRKYVMNDGMPTNANYPDRYRFSVVDGKKRVSPQRFQAMTWEHIRKFRDFWPRKLIVKSILSGDQARAAVDAGRRWHRRVEPRRTRLRQRRGDHRHAAGDRGGGRRPLHRHTRQRHPPRQRHRQGAGPRREDGAGRQGDALRHGLRRAGGRRAGDQDTFGRNGAGLRLRGRATGLRNRPAHLRGPRPGEAGPWNT